MHDLEIQVRITEYFATDDLRLELLVCDDIVLNKLRLNRNRADRHLLKIVAADRYISLSAVSNCCGRVGAAVCPFVTGHLGSRGKAHQSAGHARLCHLRDKVAGLT